MQMGTWFRTLQYAFTPQRPGHGSWHFRLMQALSEEQSELTTHSGRQLGGEPIISGRQEHWQRSPITRGGLLFGPHGFGSHGSTYSTTAEQEEHVRENLHPRFNEVFRNISLKESCVELTFGWREATCCKGIPNVISQTDTVGNVVDHLALGIYATVSLWTGVCTVQVYAGQPRWTFCVGGALWPACHIGIPKVFRDAAARSTTIPCLANSIAATRRRIAGINIDS